MALDSKKSCPYCHKKMEIVQDDEVYGKGKGFGKLLILCKPCDAYSKINPRTEMPTGVPARKALRSVRRSIFQCMKAVQEHSSRSYIDITGELRKRFDWKGVSWVSDADGLEILRIVKDHAIALGVMEDFELCDYGKKIIGTITL